MTKQSRNLLLLIAAAVIILLVGGYIYGKQKDSGTPQPQPNVDTECRTFEGNQSCAQDYIGLIESDAVSRANSLKQPYRIVQREDETFPTTQDFNRDRLNFVIKDRVVSRAEYF